MSNIGRQGIKSSYGYFMSMPRNRTEEDTHKVGVRVPVKILDKIDKFGEDHGRDRSGEINFALKEYIKSIESGAPLGVSEPSEEYKTELDELKKAFEKQQEELRVMKENMKFIDNAFKNDSEKLLMFLANKLGVAHILKEEEKD